MSATITFFALSFHAAICQVLSTAMESFIDKITISLLTAKYMGI